MPDDLIEDNLLQCFRAVNFVQHMLASSRVRIENNVVKHTTGLQTVYSIIWLILGTFSAGFFQEYFIRTIYHTNMMMYVTCSIGSMIQNVSFVLNIIVNKFTQRDKNVKVYAMLQQVDRLLQLDRCTYYNSFQNRLNTFIAILLSVGFLSGFAAHSASLIDMPGYTVFFAFGLLTIYLDVLLGVSMIYFLTVRVSVLNAIIKSQIREYKGNVVKKPEVKTLKKMVLSLIIPTVQPSSMNLSQDKWLESLQHILRCYMTVTELFSFSMLNVTSNVLIWTYVVIGGLVAGVRTGDYPFYASVTIIMCVSLYYVQLTVSAIISDWFIMEVKKLKLLCISLISYNYEGPYQKTASKMIRAIHYRTPVFVVYGIFVFDRRIPLKIIGVIATNVVVLIQFII